MKFGWLRENFCHEAWHDWFLARNESNQLTENGDAHKSMKMKLASEMKKCWNMTLHLGAVDVDLIDINMLFSVKISRNEKRTTFRGIWKEVLIYILSGVVINFRIS